MEPHTVVSPPYLTLTAQTVMRSWLFGPPADDVGIPISDRTSPIVEDTTIVMT